MGPMGSQSFPFPCTPLVTIVRQILTCSHEHNSKRELIRQPYLHLAPHYRTYTERTVSDTVLRRYYRQHGYSHRNYRRTQTRNEPIQGCGSTATGLMKTDRDQPDANNCGSQLRGTEQEQLLYNTWPIKYTN